MYDHLSTDYLFAKFRRKYATPGSYQQLISFFVRIEYYLVCQNNLMLNRAARFRKQAHSTQQRDDYNSLMQRDTIYFPMPEFKSGNIVQQIPLQMFPFPIRPLQLLPKD
jgi:hypothetical protein